MRKIKFRAWHQEGKEMVYFLPKDLIRDEYQSQALAQLMLENSKFLMQFTGLKDKNGIEIYDGDIVKDEFKRVLQIIWISDEEINLSARWGFKVIHSNINFIVNDDDVEKVEIIGNIYENPELFKNKAE